MRHSKKYITDEMRDILTHHGLCSYESLWDLDLPLVDEPNLERGGWSGVSRLELKDSAGKDHSFYIKRQVGHLTRSPMRPLGEPTFSRELRNILRYSDSSVPALQAAYYAEKKTKEGLGAILITHALDNYRALDEWLLEWESTSEDIRHKVVLAVGNLVGRLHGARITHHCMYPKHIFVGLDNAQPACFIDLEKSRFQWLRAREIIADLDSLCRNLGAWSEQEINAMLTNYLKESALKMNLQDLRTGLAARRKEKQSRRR